MKPAFHSVIKYFDKGRLFGFLLPGTLFLLVSCTELIAGGPYFKVVYYVISDGNNILTAVGINCYENNSIISLPKFRL